MERNGRPSTRVRRWAIACTVAIAVSAALGATHIHVAHPAHAIAQPDCGGPDGPFVGRDCPACALAHVSAIAGDAPTTVAPGDGRVGTVLESIGPVSSRDRTLRSPRGPPPTC